MIAVADIYIWASSFGFSKTRSSCHVLHSCARPCLHTGVQLACILAYNHFAGTTAQGIYVSDQATFLFTIWITFISFLQWVLWRLHPSTAPDKAVYEDVRKELLSPQTLGALAHLKTATRLLIHFSSRPHPL